MNLSHSHPISANIGGLSTTPSRRLTTEEKTIVQEMAGRGVGASETLILLKEKTGNLYATRRENYNEKIKAKRKYLNGRSPIRALYDEISTGNFIFDLNAGTNIYVRGLFFCYPESAELARQFNQTFIMDCTYKTNKYGIPLLNIVGVTAANSTFNAGFAFICDETEEMYPGP